MSSLHNNNNSKHLLDYINLPTKAYLAKKREPGEFYFYI
jgi:hypothetical protein